MKECSQCFADVFDETAGFCPSCGAPLAPSMAPGSRASASEPDGSPDTPLSSEQALFRQQFEQKSIHLPESALRRAEQILLAADAEIRKATILQADICGFSRYGRQATPENLSRWVREFYRICTDCILRRGGFVVKFVGDAVLAVFGAPVAFDRDVESAVWAALDIREYWRQNATGAQQSAVSIGIATGQVQAGPIDGPAGKIFDVLGDTVNLASRLQGAAGENEILVCPETLQTAGRIFEMESRQGLRLKNMAEDFEAHMVRGVRDAALPRRAFQTPFFDREKETAALGEVLEPDAPALRIAHIVGEAGMGKSRLVDEVLRRHGLIDHAIHWEGSPWSQSVLLWPVTEWLRLEMGIPHEADAASVRLVVEAYMKARFGEDGSDPLLLEYVFGVPEAIAALQGVPPERIQRNLFGLLRQILLARPLPGGASADGSPSPREAQGQQSGDAAPRAVLVVDDLQWADSLTLRFVQSLLEWPEPTNLALVLCYRSGSEPPLAPTPDHLILRLTTLADKARQDLLNAIVPTEEFLPEIRNLVLARAAGNPLFLEEMTRLIRQVMRNNRSLNGNALTNHIIEVMPASLQDLILSRIDRLDGRSRQVLQCASLLGLEFTFSLIELFDLIREGLSEHLHALRAMRYFEQAMDIRDIRYYFTHGLFRDVAYSTLLEEQKQNLHRSLAARLEQRFGERIAEYYDLLAFHFGRAGDSQKALYYLVKAGDRQAALAGARPAVTTYFEAIEILRGLEPTPPRQALMARLLIRSGRLHRLAGDHEDSAEMLAGALECAQSIHNERLSLEARLEQAIGVLWRGEYQTAEESLQALAWEASRIQHVPAHLVASNSLGVSYWQRSLHEQALHCFQELASLAEGAQAWQVQADAFNNAGLIYWRWRQLPVALKVYRRALPLRRRASDQFGLCATLMNVGIIQEQMGEVGAARRTYENALGLAHKTGFVQALAAIESNLSNLERNLGAYLPALEHGARGAEHARTAEDPSLEAAAEENLGQAYAALAQWDEAMAHFARAREAAERCGNAERLAGVRLNRLDAVSRQEVVAPEDLGEVNDLLSEIEARNFPDLRPLAFRVKSRVLDALGESNRHTAFEYLEMARDLARDSGDFFGELEAWRAIYAFDRKHDRSNGMQKALEQVLRMEGVLKNAHNSGRLAPPADE